MAARETILDNYEIFVYLAVAAFFFAGMLGIVGLTVFFSGPSSPLGGMCGVALLVLIVGGAAFLAIGLRGRSRYQRLERVAELLRAYRRIKISNLARKLEVSEMDAELTIAECIGRGLVEGYFDRQQGEFFTKEALYQVMDIKGCPKCGAPPDKLYLVGEEIRCQYCGSVGAAAVSVATKDAGE